MFVRRLMQQLIPNSPLEANPLFLVGAPRAGTVALSRLLAKADHTLPLSAIAREQAEALLKQHRSQDSDRLLADAATPELAAQLQQILQLERRTRLVDPVGANALRIPFLAAVFPQSRFVFVAQRPREQVARMIAAWRSGQYVTYPVLAGWEGPWSLPLIPDWQSQQGRSIAEIALAQWATITDLALADLAALPSERWCALSYEALRADLRGTLQQLGQRNSLRWRTIPRASDLLLHQASAADLAAADAVLGQAAATSERLHALLQTQRAERPIAPQLAQRLPRRLRQTLASGTVAATLLGASLTPAQVARAATFSVTNLNDNGAGSLRQAIADANTTLGADTITFQPGLSGTITLTSGELVISDSVDIQGPGAATISVSGNESSRVFYLYNPSTNIGVTISGVTITAGAFKAGAGLFNNNEDLILDNVAITGNSSGFGGGLWAGGPEMDLTIRNSTISGNTSSNGAGIFIYDTGGPLLIQNTVISGNQAYGNGGGIYFNDSHNNITIEGSTISGNTASGAGGGVYLYDTSGGIVTIEDTTISGNSAVAGGGLFLYGPDDPIVIENSTISGNSATEGPGGGIYFYSLGAETTIRNSTIASNNSSYAGGGIAVAYGTVTVENSIVGDNTSAPPLGAAPTSASWRTAKVVRAAKASRNTKPARTVIARRMAAPKKASASPNGIPLDGDLATLESTIELSYSLVEAPGSANITDNGGNIFGQDAQLAALANNGGPTQTHLPATTSPAINTGDPSIATPPATDQRGGSRIADGRIDIGAVERNAGTIQLSVASISVNENDGSATVTVTRTGGSDGSATFDYATADGTATAGSDYTAVNGTLTWPSGDLSDKTISVPIIDDTAIEADETLMVIDARPVLTRNNARLAANPSTTITIVDNDTITNYQAFLPVVANNQQPDLVVTNIALTPNRTTFTAGEPVEIAVTITNQGSASAGPFWVDMYLNPSEEPRVNQRWNVLCQLTPCYGIAWGVTTTVAPGQSVTLRTTVDSYAAGQSIWAGTFASGTTRLVVLADSYNPPNSSGSQLESNETNNSASLNLSVTGPNPATIATTANPQDILPRPTLP